MEQAVSKGNLDGHPQEGGILRFDEDIVFGEDIIFCTEAILRASKVVFDDHPFYHWRQRESSQSHTEDEHRWMQLIESYYRILAHMADAGISDDIRLWVERFLAYRGEVVAKLAYEHQNREVLVYSQTVMRKNRKAYRKTNQAYPDRLREFEDVLRYTL